MSKEEVGAHRLWGAPGRAVWLLCSLLPSQTLSPIAAPSSNHQHQAPLPKLCHPSMESKCQCHLSSTGFSKIVFFSWGIFPLAIEIPGWPSPDTAGSGGHCMRVPSAHWSLCITHSFFQTKKKERKEWENLDPKGWHPSPTKNKAHWKGLHVPEGFCLLS